MVKNILLLIKSVHVIYVFSALYDEMLGCLVICEERSFWSD